MKRATVPLMSGSESGTILLATTVAGSRSATTLRMLFPLLSSAQFLKQLSETVRMPSLMKSSLQPRPYDCICTGVRLFIVYLKKFTEKLNRWILLIYGKATENEKVQTSTQLAEMMHFVQYVSNTTRSSKRVHKLSKGSGFKTISFESRAKTKVLKNGVMTYVAFIAF